MFRKFLRAKVHTAKITDKNLNYEGSLGLDKKIMESAGLKPFEAVWIYNLSNGKRFETYLIEGKDGEVCLNGAAARLGEVGDRIIVVSFAWINEEEIENFEGKIVFLNEDNTIKEVKTFHIK
ncbi:MAG: aspartate 1-decarboxylase [Thermodesulfobacteria bacterium]|nr:aspartate 1-decarboxylase [Thermodesulfobacteriota bacterium]